MLGSLKLIYQQLIDEVSDKYYRHLYYSIDLDNRLIGLIGARGVGKTTLLLQIIKHKIAPFRNNVFYFSADHIYFNQVTLYSFIENLYLTENITLFFIDEIHKYPNWSQEIKNLYDGFPKINIIFSGSSSLDLLKGSYDLSRRAVIYHLPGLSFREYLNIETHQELPIIKFEQILSRQHTLEQTLSLLPGIKGHFQAFLKRGFYPFYYENPLNYYQKILSIVDKTIFEDIANFYNLRTENLRIFKKILLYLTSISPGTLSIHKLAKNLSIDDKTLTNYLNYLSETGLVHLIYPSEPGNLSLRRPEKLFLNNTNLQYALESTVAPSSDLGTLRELYFIQSIRNAGLELFHAKQGDYQIFQYHFEIGGKNKTRNQIKHLPDAFLVKDDMLSSSSTSVPLMYFGFLY